MIFLKPKKMKVHLNGQSVERAVLELDRAVAQDFDKMCEDIAKRTTLSGNEVAFVLAEVAEQVVENLRLGRATPLGKLGKIVPSISCQAVGSQEELSVDSVKKINLVYKPSIFLKRALKDLQFRIKRTKSDINNSESQ